MWLQGNGETLVDFQGKGEMSQRTLVCQNRSFPIPRHDLGACFQPKSSCFQYIYRMLQVFCNILDCFSHHHKSNTSF